MTIFQGGKARHKGGYKIFDKPDVSLERGFQMDPTQGVSGTTELHCIKERNFHLSYSARNLRGHDDKKKMHLRIIVSQL